MPFANDSRPDATGTRGRQKNTSSLHAGGDGHGTWDSVRGRPRRSKGRVCDIGKGKSRFQKWAVLGGRFGQPSGICWGLDGDGPRFRPPEGSFVNFFAKMANTVLRYRGGKIVPRRIGRATRPPAPIVLSTRQEGLMRPMMVWAHDLRCIPTSLANKIPAASNSRCGCRCAKTCATVVTTSPIDTTTQ